MNIDFKSIRTHNGDQKQGFEEFCCQMAEISIERDTGSSFLSHHFHRKEGKGGDAGVECYYVLPDGIEWAWQAKYFIDELGPKQWGQIDESVEKAVAGHPRLVRYTVCLPVNLSDARVPKKKSQTDYWREHQAKWTEQARQDGRHIEFVLWGEYELRKQLLDLGDRSAGEFFLMKEPSKICVSGTAAGRGELGQQFFYIPAINNAGWIAYKFWLFA